MIEFLLFLIRTLAFIFFFTGLCDLTVEGWKKYALWKMSLSVVLMFVYVVYWYMTWCVMCSPL